MLTMVLSPLSLWKNYDRKVMPLDVTVIKESEEEGYCEKLVYYNGEVSPHGCTRIFARLLTPNEKTDTVVLVMAEQHQALRTVDCTHFLQSGYAVLIVDYAGNAFDHDRFTIYPRALSFANYDEKALFAPTETPFKSCWYVWATVAMRSVTYLEDCGFTKIGLFGIGYGGAQMIKCAAVCQGVLGAVTLYSPGFLPPEEDDPALLAVRVGVHTAAYAPCLQAPVLMLCCSNDTDGALDDISEFCAQSSGYAIYYAEPRMSRGKTIHIETNIELFFKKMFEGTLQPKLYKNVGIKAAGSENKVYYSLLQGTDNPIADEGHTEKLQFSNAMLYVSQGVKNPTYRNWRAIPLEKAGENDYFAYTEVYSSEKILYSYVCLERDGFIFSTPILKKIPSTLNVKAKATDKKRLVYDSEMQIDDFFTSDQTMYPEIKTGPFGIEGIAANTLNTYKIGNEVYSGE